MNRDNIEIIQESTQVPFKYSFFCFYKFSNDIASMTFINSLDIVISKSSIISAVL